MMLIGVFVLIFLNFVQFIFVLLLFMKGSGKSVGDLISSSISPILETSNNIQGEIEEQKRLLQETRGEIRENTEQLKALINATSQKSYEQTNNSLLGFSHLLEQKLGNVQLQNTVAIKEMREELSRTLSSFEVKFGENVKALSSTQKEKFDELKTEQSKLTSDTLLVLEKVRESVEQKLQDIQRDNTDKLEKMRATVDEKLHSTLEKRLTSSFQLVSERLEKVQQGLGEMQRLATDVGDLKNVLSNVKKTGILGEYQLEAILNEILNPSQYEMQIPIKKGSSEKVDFAVKIPSKDDDERIVFLPIDAKFPTKHYLVLTEAYNNGNVQQIKESSVALQREIRMFAKSISDKYIDEPNTTNFAIMFLPFEGLFAEVLRLPGLLESVYKDYKIVITGPTTIAALLNSLQVGFRTIAVQKGTSEILKLLGAVRTEFSKFGTVLEKTKKHLESASKDIGDIESRANIMEKKLKGVEKLPEDESALLLE